MRFILAAVDHSIQLYRKPMDQERRGDWQKLWRKKHMLTTPKWLPASWKHGNILMAIWLDGQKNTNLIQNNFIQQLE